MRCEQGHNLPALVPCREAGKLPSEGPSLPGDGIYWEGPVLGHQCSRPHRAHQVQEPVSLRAPWPLTCFQTRWHSREHPPPRPRAACACALRNQVSARGAQGWLQGRARASPAARLLGPAPESGFKLQ